MSTQRFHLGALASSYGSICQHCCGESCSQVIIPFRRRAFSLVEVVLAIGVVSFAFLTLLALLPIGLKSEKTSSNETSAVNLMQSVVTDLSMTPLTNAGSTNNTYSVRLGLSPLPGNVAAPVAANFYLTEGQVATNAAAAQYRVVVNYTPASTTVGAYTPPAALIQIFWPAAAVTNSAQGMYESYVTFPPYTL